MKRFEFVQFLNVAIIAASLAGVVDAQTIDPDDFLLVTSFDTHNVLRYDAATGAFVDEFVPRKSGGMNHPYGAIFGPHDNHLYVSTGQFGGQGQIRAVLRYDGETGEFVDNFAVGADLNSPRGVIFGPEGNLYVADHTTSGGRVVRYDGTTGAFLDEFVSIAGSGGLHRPQGLLFGPDNNGDGQLDLYVSSATNSSVLHYDGTTGAFLGEFVASGSGGMDHATGLTFGPDGNLYAANFALGTGNTAVLRYQGPSGQSPGAFIDEFVPAGSGGLQTPFAVLFGPDGNGDGQQDFYVANSEINSGNLGAKAQTSSVKRYDGVTGAFIDTFVTEGSGGLDNPSLMTFTETDPVTLQYLGVSGARLAAQSVPEPTCLLLASLSAAGMALYGWRRRPTGIVVFSRS